MQNIPQVVRERLKAGSVNSGHPDADVLTAFSEQSLSARQRGEVLEHLAKCGDCREIVALALPPVEQLQDGVAHIRLAWLSWPVFRWASVAAGIAILAVGALQYEAHMRPTRSLATVAKQVTQVQPMAAEGQVVSPAPSATVPVIPKHEQHPVAGDSVAARVTSKSTPQAPGLKFAQKSREADKNSPMQGSQQAAVAQSLPAPAVTEAANGRNITSLQTVEVQSQSEMVQVEPQVAQAEAPASVFDNSPRPVGKAKAAIVPALQSASGSALATSRWSISPTGGLQRSFDQGNTWQDVDVNVGLTNLAASSFQISRDDSIAPKDVQKKSSKQLSSGPVFRAIAVNGADVWAGGSGAALYHSTDSGDHWVRVNPSISGTLMSGDVVSLEFPSPGNGSITTSSGEIWSTNDSGQSWTKR